MTANRGCLRPNWENSTPDPTPIPAERRKPPGSGTMSPAELSPRRNSQVEWIEWSVVSFRSSSNHVHLPSLRSTCIEYVRRQDSFAKLADRRQTPIRLPYIDEPSISLKIRKNLLLIGFPLCSLKQRKPIRHSRLFRFDRRVSTGALSAGVRC